MSRKANSAGWAHLLDKDGVIVTTLPFCGVFYPVELAFHLLE
jgi:hypothetical protein